MFQQNTLEQKYRPFNNVLSKLLNILLMAQKSG